MKLAICDDEKNNLKTLQTILMCYAKDKNLQFSVDVYQSGRELLDAANKYNLIFLDIDMPDLNGIETGKKIGEKDVNVQIIYVTNHAAYMQDAFTVRPFGYVLKPITAEKIFSELDEFIRREELKRKANKVMFSGKNGDVILNIEEIYCIEVFGKNLLKITTDKEVVYVVSSLNDAFLKLEKHHFAIPHQSFIVNLFYVKLFESSTLIMKNGYKVPVAQKKFATFKKEFIEYIHKDTQ